MQRRPQSGLRWRDAHLERGKLELDFNKTDAPRDWDLNPGTLAVLRWWHDMKKTTTEPDDHVFAEDGVPINVAHLAFQLRADLKRAGVTRAELFERSSARQPLRAHDLRSTFITTALANGKTETWVADRTGHTTSQMINAYRRKARTWSALAQGDLVPLHCAIPEVSGDVATGGYHPPTARQDHEHGWRNGIRSGFRFRRRKA